MFDSGPMTVEELEQIRRSLGMSPSLPGNVAERMLREIHRLQAEQGLTRTTLKELLERLD
jgi:hypothetical protein